jgi:hypothetical protein
MVRGIVLNDKDVVHYRTEAEEEALLDEEQRKYDEKKKRWFEESGKSKLDADYKSLPDVFKQRIDRFRNANPDFGWKFESYEMACCVDAVYLADLMKTPEAVKESSGWREGMVSDSGNQVECAHYLAYWYLKDPSTIPQIKGALSPLMKTADYSEETLPSCGHGV